MVEITASLKLTALFLYNMPEMASLPKDFDEMSVPGFSGLLYFKLRS